MAAKMSAKEFKESTKASGWTTQASIAEALGISIRSVHTYSTTGCPLKGASNRMRKQMEQARKAGSA